MTCAKCGGALEAGKRFCGECGTPVAGVPPAASRRGLFFGIGGVAIGSGLTYLVTRGPSASSLATPTLAPTIPVPTRAPAAPAPTMAPAPASSKRLVVDASGSGDYKTIDGANFNAKAGETIVVRPGTYRESLKIKSDVRIVGEGGRSKVIVESAGLPVFSFTAGSATLTGLTIRIVGTGIVINGQHYRGWGAINVEGGTPVIEDCDLTSSAGPAVHISGAGANPVIRNCTIRDSLGHGVVVGEGQGTIEKCVIRDNTGAGVWIGDGGNPAVRDCEIRDNKAAGVCIWLKGQGTFTGNTLKGNARGAWDIWDIEPTAGRVTRTGNTPNE